MKPSPLLSCELAGTCSGCPWILKLYSDQLLEKKDRFLRRLPRGGFLPNALHDFDIFPVPVDHLRDRADLVLETRLGQHTLGLWDMGRKTLLNLKACPLLTASLESWLIEFKNDLPSVAKGSIRLRVNPQSIKGVWLDFSNQDIKRLLEEGDWLERLQAKAIVEIGQKRKRLIRKEDRWALGDPVLFPWSETYFFEQSLPLFTSIGGFTQSGPQATQVLSEVFLKLLPEEVPSWLELGSGSGTFTLPLLSAGKRVNAVEMDAQALKGLLQGAAHSGISALLSTHLLDFNGKKDTLRRLFEENRGVIVDPPRSGLGNLVSFLTELIPSQRPDYFYYVSCWEDSFVSDVHGLNELGYLGTRLFGVDQFPQSPLFEILALFQKQY